MTVSVIERIISLNKQFLFKEDQVTVQPDENIETLFEDQVTLDFHGKSTYTFKHTRFEIRGKVYENMCLIGSRGAYYDLQHLNIYGNRPDLEGVYQPIGRGGPLMKKGNPMYVFIVGGIVSVFTKKF